MSGFPVLIFWSGPPGPIWHFCLPAGPLWKLKISQKRNYMPPNCILGAKKHWEMRTPQNVPTLTVSLPHDVTRPSSSNFQWRWYVHRPQKHFAVVGLTPAVWEWSSKWKTPAFARIILNQNGSYQDDDVEGWNYNFFLGCDMSVACFGSALSSVNPSYLRAGNFRIWWYFIKYYI